jgi:hypothetical protein
MDPVTPSPETPAPAKHGWRVALASAVVLVVGIGAFLGIYLPTHQHSTAAGTSNPAVTGCPSAAAPPASAPGANETIQETDGNRITQAKVGDIISVSLPSSSEFYWTYQSSPTAALQMLSPTGYYDAAHHACVWNIKANGAGQNMLVFVRQPTCHKGFACSPFEILFRFALVVH